MHVHSQSSHDSTASVLETARLCAERGILGFAVTDHCDIQYYDESITLNSVKGSLDEVTEAQALCPQVKILKGIEVGEGIWDKEHTDKILNSFDFDVVIGSVHAVRYKCYTDPYSTIDFSKMTSGELDEFLTVYFDDVLEMVQTYDCDILAHLTCPLRYIVGKYKRKADAQKYKEQIVKILECIIERDISLEINTSGIGTFYGKLMPEEWVIRLYKELGGTLITLGSDAHVSNSVANGFEPAITLLTEIGYDGYYYYENRQSVFVPFNKQ